MTILLRHALRRPVAALLLSACLLVPRNAMAQACDAATQERLAFLEARLDEGRTHAEWWWKSWLGIFILGAVIQSANAGWEENSSERANDYISVGKSLLGVAELSFRPLAGMEGADPMRAISTTTPEGCARRLRLAESVLRKAAEQADSRFSVARHVTAFAINLTGAIVVAEGWRDPKTGWSAFGVSTVAGEIHTWSAPGQPSDDWAEYRERFDGASTARRSEWRFASGGSGLGVIWSF